MTDKLSARFATINQLHEATSEANATRRTAALDYLSAMAWAQLEAHAKSHDRASRYLIVDKFTIVYESYLSYKEILAKPTKPDVIYVSDYTRTLDALRLEAPEITWTLVDLHAIFKCGCTAEQRAEKSCNYHGIEAVWTWAREMPDLT